MFGVGHERCVFRQSTTGKRDDGKAHIKKERHSYTVFDLIFEVRVIVLLHRHFLWIFDKQPAANRDGNSRHRIYAGTVAISCPLTCLY